jgi:hypothetical protein
MLLLLPPSQLLPFLLFELLLLSLLFDFYFKLLILFEFCTL